MTPFLPESEFPGWPSVVRWTLWVFVVALLSSAGTLVAEPPEVEFFNFEDRKAIREATGQHPANVENVRMKNDDSTFHGTDQFEDAERGTPISWSVWKVDIPDEMSLEEGQFERIKLTASVEVRGKGRSDALKGNKGSSLFVQWSTDGENWRDFSSFEERKGISKKGEMEYPSEGKWQMPSGTTLTGTVKIVEHHPEIYLRVATDGSAWIDWHGWSVSVNAARWEDNLTIITPDVPRDRIMNPVAEAFERYSGNNVRLWKPGRRGRWSAIGHHKLRDNSATILLTSREDWEYRATDSQREQLRYVPMARKLVHRAGKEVGSVEYGVALPREGAASVSEGFVEFIDSGEMREVLEEPDPYNYVPLDHEVVDFEPPEWFGDPGEGPKPELWQGVCQLTHGNYFSVALAELKTIWMQGYNQLQGVPLTDPVVQWAEDHGFVLTGLPGGEDFADRIRRALESPILRGMYAENEDDLDRVYRPVYDVHYRLEAGDDEEDIGETALHAYETVKEQFPRWLRRRHGDLETLNRRWESSYDEWEEIGLPELPLDWLVEVCNATGEREGGLSKRDGIYRLFHDPIHFHLYARRPDLLDFRRYMREAWGRKYKALVSGHGPGQFWDEDYTNRAREFTSLIEDGQFFYTTKTRPDPYLYREVEEFNAAAYAHPQWQVPPHLIQMPVDTLQTALGWPVWNAEHHMSPSVSPESTRYTLLHTSLMGQFKNSGYNRQITYMSGRPDKPGRYDSAKWEPFFKSENKSRTQIRRHEDVFRAFVQARAAADIAVLVTEGNRGWNTLPEHAERPEMGGAVKAYGQVGRLGRQWKYVLDKDVSAKEVTGTLIVAAPWLTTETAEKISKLPKDRRIVVVGELPSTNEYGESLSQDVLQRLQENATVIGGWDELTDVIEPAEGLSGPYTELSSAKFWWWGRVTGRAGFGMPVPELELRHVSDGGNRYVAVTNHSSDSKVTASLPWAVGKKVREFTVEGQESWVYREGDEVEFPPLSVKIFEITDEE
ncbi:MAG: beta-galactosidase [Planctomycetota bacterium]